MFKMRWLSEEHNDNKGGDWRSSLPENLRTDPSLSSFKDVSALAQSFVETKALVGRSIRPLGQNATPEEKKQFVEKLLQVEPALIYAPEGDEDAAKRLFKKLGRPEKPEDYKFDEDSVTAAGLKPNDLRALAVTAGLTQKQAEALAKVMVEANLESKRVYSLEQAAIDERWGAAKEERILAAKAAALKMGLNEQEIATLRPKQLEAFYNVARAVGVNQNEFRQHGNGGTPPLDREEAKQELAKIRANPVYWNKHQNPAQHELLTKRATELTKMLG